MRLLTIGNSFAGNATRFLDDIVGASGRFSLALGKANIGGCSLERHWNHVVRHKDDPADPEGKPYDGRSLKDMLLSDAWDVVTIQQFSWISHDVDTYRPYARYLHDYARAYAPGAEVRFHQTWAYRADDDGRIGPEYSQAQMHADIRAACHAVAAELGITIIPVGEAFANARKHPEWNFSRDPAYDYENPTYPELPSEPQSLCRGYFWREDEEGGHSLGLDTHHANTAGEYLGAAVFYECLFGESVVGNRFVPEGVTEKDAAFLQRIAHETVQDTSNVTPGT